MDHIKKFVKNEKELVTLIQKIMYCKDIGVESRIEKCHANNKNW